jgi:hypothetical protein
MLVFGKDRLNLKDITYEEKHADEKTYALAAGKGEKTDRVWGEAVSGALNASPWNRREMTLDGRDTDVVATLQKAAADELMLNKAKLSVSGTVVQTPGCRYGVDYNFGDLVVAEAFGTPVNCRLSTIHITINEAGLETIDLKLRGEV